ncbi:MAG TPA: HEAT repeat domain-containing protein [Candidatus Acidoferrales bacterium]|nr:HEAT repeat domain-containing protein [Candidatus Acidoferrales bacterium]
MNCEKVREQIPELLAGRLDETARQSVVEHLETCAGCRSEVAELNTVWRGMDNLNSGADAEPDPAAKARFLEVLRAYEAGMGVSQAAPKPRVIAFPQHPAWGIAIAAGLLVAGVALGRYQLRPTENIEVAQLKGQIEGLRQMVALSMLQQQSPSARLRGVTYTEQMSQPDREVTDALLFAIKNDGNVNVRLSAVDALQKFSGDPRVVPAMIEAIPGQESPMVQMALIDMLVQLNARSAANDLARLSKDPQLQEVVQQRASWALQQLEGRR